MALAMAGGASLPNSKTFALSGGWGTFEGSNALGFGAIGRVSDKVYLTGGVGMGLNNSTVGGRAGFLFAWCEPSEQALSGPGNRAASVSP
jgi:trimeric autotransporter adhesin